MNLANSIFLVCHVATKWSGDTTMRVERSVKLLKTLYKNMQAYFSLCKYIYKILNTLNSESLGVCRQSQSPTPTVTATDPPLANSPTMYSKLVHQDWHFCLGVLINGIRQHTERRTLGLVDWLSLAADIRDTSQCVAIVALILQNPKNYLFRAWIAVRFMSAAICFSWRCLRVWIKPVSLLLLFAACCAFLWQKYPSCFLSQVWSYAGLGWQQPSCLG